MTNGRRLTRAAAAMFLATAAGTHATADNIARRTPDQALHTLYMQRADMERNALSHRYPWVAQRANDLLIANPILARQDPWLQLYHALALSGLGLHQESVRECEDLIQNYGATTPLVAAWAQVWVGHNYRRMGSMGAAMVAYRAVEDFAPELQDLGPVMEARHNAAEYFLRTTRFDPSFPDQPEILSFASDDKEAWAWARGAVCARMAHMGNYEAAQEEYDRLIKLVGPADRRVAIAGIDLACGEIEGYDSGRRTMMDALVHAQRVIEDIEQMFPAEHWLIARGKLRVTLFHLSHTLDLPKAERLAREVAEAQWETGLEAEAGARLVEILFHMKRYEECVRASKELEADFPYTRWAHFTATLQAEAYKAMGDQPSYIETLDRIIATYPETAYGEEAVYVRERISQ